MVPVMVTERDADKTLVQVVRAALRDFAQELEQGVSEDDATCSARNRIFTALEARGVNIHATTVPGLRP